MLKLSAIGHRLLTKLVTNPVSGWHAIGRQESISDTKWR